MVSCKLTGGLQGQRWCPDVPKAVIPANGKPSKCAPPVNIFHKTLFAMELSAKTSFKEKKELKEIIILAGGTITCVVNHKVQFLILSNASQADTYKCRLALKCQIPVVSPLFVTQCVAEGKIVDVDDFLICGLRRLEQLGSGKISGRLSGQNDPSSDSTALGNRLLPIDWRKAQLILPPPDFQKTYQVPKWVFLSSKAEINRRLCVIEIHVFPAAVDAKESESHQLYRVYTEVSQLKSPDQKTVEVRPAAGPLQAEQLFLSLFNHYEKDLAFTRSQSVPARVGSPALQKRVFAESLTDLEMAPDTTRLVENIWAEAVGELSEELSVSASNVNALSVDEAEAVFLQMKAELAKSNLDAVKTLCSEVYGILPFKRPVEVTSLSDLVRYLRVVQLLRDVVSVGESTDWNFSVSSMDKLRALGCYLGMCESKRVVEELFLSTLGELSQKVSVRGVYEVWRPGEFLNMPRPSATVQLLFHASKPENILGICSRGLLLPRVVVDEFGVQRSDPGMLGQGIYFADRSATSLKYTRPCRSTSSVFMFVCEVVTGLPFVTREMLPDLTAPPVGYDSVLGAQKTVEEASVFESNEYAVYSTERQRLRYIVEFNVVDELPPQFPQGLSKGLYEPARNRELEDAQPDHGKKGVTSLANDQNNRCVTAEVLTAGDLIGLADPTVQAQPGLMSQSEEPLPLRSVHIVAKLVDMAAEVTMLQEYFNSSTHSIEAKFVFPLSDGAAVCGFEAYINNKHIVGEVQERRTAHQQYRDAVSAGHGAYLMDQDKEHPDLFTVSVGNLPASSVVIIKIIYVCLLNVDGDNMIFSLPANLAPWKARQTLVEKTQSSTETAKVIGGLELMPMSLTLAVQMPTVIKKIASSSHKIAIKQTDTMATVRMLEGQVLESGFLLSLTLAEVHVPKMVLERNPSNDDDHACMLTFYPEFECKTSLHYDLLVLIDCSNSLSAADFVASQKAALLVVSRIPRTASFNITAFATYQKDVFVSSLPATPTNIKAATEFIRGLKPHQGNTNLHTVLQNIAPLVDPSRMKNILLISDCCFTNRSESVLEVRELRPSARVFVLGIGASLSRYNMREIALVSGGYSQHLDSKRLSKWESQINGILNMLSQPALCDVSVVWNEQNTGYPIPLQAPRVISTLFNGSRLVVFGFASHCYMATLKAQIGGQEVSTVVSSSPLSSCAGLTIHRLAANAVIQDWQHGSLSRAPDDHALKKKRLTDDIIELSIRYSLVTPLTSFIAIEKRDGAEAETTGPSVTDLLAEINPDQLLYLGWDQDCATLTGQLVRQQKEEEEEDFCVDEQVYSCQPQKAHSVRESKDRRKDDWAKIKKKRFTSRDCEMAVKNDYESETLSLEADDCNSPVGTLNNPTMALNQQISQSTEVRGLSGFSSVFAAAKSESPSYGFGVFGCSPIAGPSGGFGLLPGGEPSSSGLFGFTPDREPAIGSFQSDRPSGGAFGFSRIVEPFHQALGLSADGDQFGSTVVSNQSGRLFGDISWSQAGMINGFGLSKSREPFESLQSGGSSRGPFESLQSGGSSGGPFEWLQSGGSSREPFESLLSGGSSGGLFGSFETNVLLSPQQKSEFFSLVAADSSPLPSPDYEQSKERLCVRNTIEIANNILGSSSKGPAFVPLHTNDLAAPPRALSRGGKPPAPLLLEEECSSLKRSSMFAVAALPQQSVTRVSCSSNQTEIEPLTAEASGDQPYPQPQRSRSSLSQMLAFKQPSAKKHFARKPSVPISFSVFSDLENDSTKQPPPCPPPPQTFLHNVKGNPSIEYNTNSQSYQYEVMASVPPPPPPLPLIRHAMAEQSDHTIPSDKPAYQTNCCTVPYSGSAVFTDSQSFQHRPTECVPPLPSPCAVLPRALIAIRKLAHPKHPALPRGLRQQTRPECNTLMPRSPQMCSIVMLFPSRSELDQFLSTDVAECHHILFRETVLNWLKEAGLQSLGPTVWSRITHHVVLLLLLYNYLVVQKSFELQENAQERKELDNTSLPGDIFSLAEDSVNQLPSEQERDVLRSVIQWCRQTDRLYPSMCSTLELGKNWASALNNSVLMTLIRQA